jgi:hypothetical protein
MAQAYEYKLEAATAANSQSLLSALATDDAAGWEVIGFSIDGTDHVLWALLRRRI